MKELLIGLDYGTEFAAAVSGVHKDVETAMAAMGPGFEKVYEPQPREVEALERKYSDYMRMGAALEAFGKGRRQ